MSDKCKLIPSVGKAECCPKDYPYKDPSPLKSFFGKKEPAISKSSQAVVEAVIRYDDCISYGMLSTSSSAVQETKEENMNTTATLTAAQQHLLSRFREVEHNKTSFYSPEVKALRAKFRMDGPPEPKHAEEALEWIKAGRYTLNEKKIARVKASIEARDDDDDDDFCCAYYSWTHGFTWGTKDEQPDRDGYDKAYAELKSAAQKVKDAIYVKSADEALKALEAFESKTFH